MKSAIAVCLLLACAAWADPVAPGTYKGKWEGSAGSSGEIRMTLSDKGGWSGKVSFGLGGQDVKCTVKSIQVDGSKLRMVYSFDLQGTVLQSAIEGEQTGGKLSGKYKTTVPGDGSSVDEGTWSATGSR